MKIAYFPGCSLHSTGAEFDISTRKVCAALDIELCEVKDWVCCGSSPAHQCDELMSVALPAKILAQTVRTDNLKELCAPCASCYSRLKFTQKRMQDEKWKKDVEHVIGDKYPDDIAVMNMIDVVTNKVGIDTLADKVVKPLNGIKIACYYGCLLTRPPKIVDKENFENPQDMDAIIEAIGAEPIDWNLKTFCCGAGFTLTQTHVVLELTRKIFVDAQAAGAEAIAVACPLCHANLDTRQEDVNKKFNTNFKIPIFYFTQLIGLSLGMSARSLALYRHLTEVEDFLKERALV